MQYHGVAWATALLGLLILVVAARLLSSRDWLLGWLRGTLGLAFLALAVAAGLVAYDLSSYRSLPEDGKLATLSFHADGPQHYRVELEDGGRIRTLVVNGDLWQLNARLFRWKGLAALIGLEPGYRQELLRGRYLSIEQQQLAPGAPVRLAEGPMGVDTWRWLRMSPRDFGLFDPRALHTAFLPMADNAVYVVDLSIAGLAVRPLSAEARQAMQAW